MNAIEALAFMKDTGQSVVSFTKGSFIGKERFSLHDEKELAIWTFGVSEDPMIPDDYIQISSFLQAYSKNLFVPIEPDKIRNPWLEN